jgi:protein O-mannosyl-transferase
MLAPARDEPEQVRPRATTTLLLWLSLVVVTMAAYGSLWRNGFLNYDDDRYILTNPHVRAGLTGATVTWAIKSLDEANWHPVTWLSHALDCQLFQLSPAGHHATSLLLHAANVLLLFVLLARATGARWRSLIVAALFAIHPVNVESVAWIAERKTVLAMLFLLLALGAYGWYARQPSLRRYLLVTSAFALALMSKPMAITLPFALLLLDYWPLQWMNFASANPPDSRLAQNTPTFGRFSPRSFSRLILEKVPLVALSAASALVTVVAQKAGGAISANAAHAPLLRVENAVVCYVRYLAIAFWPEHLAALYPYPHSLRAWQVIASSLFLLAVTAVVLRYRELRYLVVGWFWYLGTMVPMIGLVQVGNQAMADRYAYLPVIGLLVIAVWGVADLVSVLVTQCGIATKLEAALAAISIFVLALLTHRQVTYWRDDMTLWSHTIELTDGNFVAENNLGAILANHGRYDEAAAHFRNASLLEPDDPVSQLNLGIYAHQLGDLKQAIMRYTATLRFATDRRIRASAYANLGEIYFQQSDYPRARANYEAAAALDDPFPIQLGLIANKVGDSDQAIRYFAEAVAAEPTDVGYLLLAHALQDSGQQEKARRARERAQQLSHDLSRAQQIADTLLVR